MNVKIWAYLGIILAVLGFARWGYVAVHDAGYNAAVVEFKEASAQLEKDVREDEAAKWAEVVEKARGQIITEEVIVEKIREVEKEIPVVVEKIVTVKPECDDLGPEFAGLLTQQARAGIDREVPNP